MPPERDVSSRSGPILACLEEEKELLNLRDCILVPLEEVATYCHSNLIKAGR